MELSKGLDWKKTSADVWDTRMALETTKDWSGIEQIVPRNPLGASVRVSLLGGRVTSWRNERGEELLFMSNKVKEKARLNLHGIVSVESAQGAIVFSNIVTTVSPMYSQEVPPDFTGCWLWGWHMCRVWWRCILTICWCEVRVEGLEALDYFDNLSKRERYTEQADAITFDGEIHRVYLSTPTKIAIIDHEKKRTIVLRKEGMVDASFFSYLYF
ncbi:putative aldose 1-/Glucose-6-phosphate 1-epimerase, galactose mutarotase-like domain superfamily [Helianthus debilis subsp. tardiflorus]